MATAAAKRYARAVFELAQHDGDIARWGRRLGVVRELLTDPEVAAVLSNPTIPTETRESLISTTRDDFDREAANLAKLLVESGRIGEAAAIDEEFQGLADEAAGRVRATATTAIELTESDRERIRQELAKRLKKDVKLSVVVDPRVLGGLKVQFGDRIIDATVATRLQQLRRRLVSS